MNGAQDLGGMHGFGPVVPEPETEPNFHAPWERRAFGVTLAMGATGSWTLDASRHARESLPPAEYLASSYYEIWTKGLERLVLAAGLVGADELAAGRSLRPGARLSRMLSAEAVPAALARGGPTERETSAPPRFAVGDRVRTIVTNPAGHTRLPRYARGKTGTIEIAHGAHVFPDTNAHGGGEAPQHLYTVRFTGSELWGEGADPTLSVSIDAWERYLHGA
ncbi:nitrile hydratase subunit beta [Salinarimonas ramus]|uniref:Nitrile hydratase subunit beta n=1 Tax=Salinarimonas ramus TaxID=690164 RepID=A0A917Q571_9HYPH|nr:nitrile hydratase subunit beta [Salinarimonas ramus]GGK23475.1 low-molecular weight cobalt-containing nitrile hydratase subunit beta [Salinarimonas ramus]